MLALLCGVLCASAASDRPVAEWTLFMGGAVGLEGRPGLIRNIADLPEGDLRVQVLDWVGMNVDPPDLERVGGLQYLKELHLPGPIWNRNADGNRDGSRDLRFLAKVTTIEKLTFSYHFLDRIRFRDSGLEEIAGLTNLRELVVRQAAIDGRALAPFRQLRSLDVTLTRTNDAGLRNVAGMTRLRRLWAGDTAITDNGLEALSRLEALEDLDLHGTEITDAGLLHLKGLVRLRKLNLMGTRISDAGLDRLQAMTQLEELNLYRTHVTNAGLERLRNLKTLAEVDLPYTRATRAGVDALQKSVPGAKLIFLDTAARVSIPPGVNEHVNGKGMRRSPRGYEPWVDRRSWREDGWWRHRSRRRRSPMNNWRT